MKQTFETNKSVQETANAIKEIAPNYKFGVLHIHNIKETLISKGIEFQKECQVLDVCNPNIANQLLSEDLSLSCIMPCKVAIYNDNGQTTIALNSLVQLVDDINPDLVHIAQEAQGSLIKIIEEAI